MQLMGVPWGLTVGLAGTVICKCVHISMYTDLCYGLRMPYWKGPGETSPGWRLEQEWTRGGVVSQRGAPRGSLS